MTRDTVAWETPALTATSAMPILPVADLLAMVVPSFALRAVSLARAAALDVLLPKQVRAAFS
jgi:hypothetical protein